MVAMITAITSALSDPEGCRRALFAYGGEWAWPACRLGPITFKEGPESWVQAVNAAAPLMLGLAWEAAETNGNENPATSRPDAQRALEPSKDEEKPMTVMQWKEYTGPKPGYYPARVAEIVDQPASVKTPAMQFEPRPQFRFRMVILDDLGHDTVEEMSAWCNQVWGPKSRLLEWAQVILRAKCPKPTEPLDTDVLVNRKVDIQVEQPDPEKNPKITKLFPYRTMSVRQDEDEDTPAAKKAEAAFA